MRQAKEYHFGHRLCWSYLYAKDENDNFYSVSVRDCDYDDQRRMEHDLIIKMQKKHGLATVY